MPRETFLDARRLLHGPWQAFERDIARMLLVEGFDDVRIVAGSGDRGADVLGIKDERLWVFQCKYTQERSPSRSAINEVVAAGRYYKADQLGIAVSRSPGPGFESAIEREKRAGLEIKVAGPSDLIDIMEVAAEFPKARRDLRDYQKDAVAAMNGALLDTGRAQLVMATGLGKTVVMAELAAELLSDGAVPHNRVMVVAHTVPLVEQLHQSFWNQLPTTVPTHQLGSGEKPSFWEGICFSTIQSAGLHELPQIGMLMVDEAHHIGAPTFRSVVDGVEPDLLVGATATPWRGDGFDIDTILGQPVVEIGIEEGLRKGFLAETDYRILADNIDWEFVQRASKNKYSITQLNRRLIIPTRDDKAAVVVARAFRKEGRQACIAYSPTGVHAKHFAGVLRQHGLRAEAILAEYEPRLRDARMARFRGGDLDVAVTVDLFNEGVDVPDVDLIVFMRSTHSRRIFVQQLGRGLRLSKDKEKVIVLDFVTDVRRVAEVVQLDRAVKGGVERLGMGGHLVSFSDESSGSFLQEWMLDQASLSERPGDFELRLPEFDDFPEPRPPGNVQ